MSLASLDIILESVLTRHKVIGSTTLIIDPAQNRDGFFTAFASLGWQLRRITLRLQPAEQTGLYEAGLVAPERLTIAELARTRLLRQSLSLLPDTDRAGLVHELFRSGDNAERETVLKVLPLLPEPQHFLETALDACRSAVQTTVEAITCDNVYPARYFSPDAFRGMVLKALHLGLPLARIYDLARHIDSEMTRMAADYANELRAACRPVPADIVLITR